MNVVMSASSHTGRKHDKNEDRFIADAKRGLALVADGMSVGYGDYASSIAAQIVQEYVASGMAQKSNSQNLLREAVLAANFAIYRYTMANPATAGMGTTVTAALIRETDVVIAHVGDSRCLRIRPEGLVTLTQDHTSVHPTSSRTMLTRSVGIDEKLEVDTYLSPLEADDYLMLCSDGVSNHVGEEEILRVFRKHRAWESPTTSVLLDRILTDLRLSAKARGSDDDITVVIARHSEISKDAEP